MNVEPSEPGLDLDAFRRYDVQALKHYLRKRNLSLVGRKDVLVARAFAAHEAQVPIALTPSESDKLREDQYKDLLMTEEEGSLPDPMYNLVDGWVGEKNGKQLWPPSFIEDISYFLVKNETSYGKVSLAKRLLSDYKEQKAFSYFKSEFLYEVHYNKISDNSIFCFLRAKCTPSMRLNNIPHETWICIRKDTGEIQSAYCTCFAGLGQTCNHVAAVLFKVDSAWKMGDVKKGDDIACTSQPCSWNIAPPVKAEPLRISEMHICKPKAERHTVPRPLNSAKKQLFGKPKRNAGMTQKKFLEKLAEISPDSVTLGERKPERNPVYLQYDNLSQDKDVPVPPSVQDIASECKSVEELFAKMETVFSNENVRNIEEATRQQGGLWKSQRHGRITASKFHRVHTRMNTYATNTSVNMEPLICEVLQYQSPPSGLPALKYGCRMEDVAANKYGKVMVELGHKNVQVKKCGLFVAESVPYIGASPDRIVSCDCCGVRILEIKCPLKCSHTVPSQENVDCLHFNEQGVLALKTSHTYYTQIQGQMAIAECNKADFFVFSMHGYHIEELQFNVDYWEKVSINLSTCFCLFIAEELITRKVQMHVSATEMDTKSLTGSTIDEEVKIRSIPGIILPKPKAKGKKKTKGKGKAPKITPVYLCGLCSKRCIDVSTMSNENENSVYCDKCHKWYHMVCLGITDESSDLEDEEYHCPKCKV